MNPSSGHSTTTKVTLGSGAVQISSGKICEVTEVRMCSQGRPWSHLLTPHHPLQRSADIRPPPAPFSPSPLTRRQAAAGWQRAFHTWRGQTARHGTHGSLRSCGPDVLTSRDMIIPLGHTSEFHPYGVHPELKYKGEHPSYKETPKS